jgi:hypothetical protein
MADGGSGVTGEGIYSYSGEGQGGGEGRRRLGKAMVVARGGEGARVAPI